LLVPREGGKETLIRVFVHDKKKTLIAEIFVSEERKISFGRGSKRRSSHYAGKAKRHETVVPRDLTLKPEGRIAAEFAPKNWASSGE